MNNSDKKIKVAEFIPTIQDGGAETLVKDYIQLIDKNKFEPIVIVYARTPNTANDRILTEYGARIISIRKNNSFISKAFVKFNRWWYVPYRLKKILKKEKVEVLHIHLELLKCVKKISSSIKKIKLLYTCHSEPERFLGLHRPYEKKSAEHLLKNNNLQIIALHDDMKNEINKMFQINNTIVIRNGIDFNRFVDVEESVEQIRSKLKIPLNAYVVGHVGRFANPKNHGFLIDVFKEISKRHDDAFLLLVGSGPLKEQIEEKLNDYELKGKYLILSNRPDIPLLMKAMNVFLFPSLFEGLSVTLIEAQVLGLRCVVSDKINKETFQNESVVPVSLDEPIEKWADIILDEAIKGPYKGNIDNYNMNKEIKRLEKLYMGEFNE